MPLCALEMQRHHKRELSHGKANSANLLIRMTSFAGEEQSTRRPTPQAHFPLVCGWEICETSHCHPARSSKATGLDFPLFKKKNQKTKTNKKKNQPKKAKVFSVFKIIPKKPFGQRSGNRDDRNEMTMGYLGGLSTARLLLTP